MKFHNFWLLLVASATIFTVAVAYNRPPPRKNLVLSPADDADSTTPQQVHISLVGKNKMRISWITDDRTPATVHYGTSSEKHEYSVTGTVSSYLYIYITI
ncbi:putative Acid phosphatase [Helianthus annuus]|nr:putative Acid phosphatase [Helianthus annuus]